MKRNSIPGSFAAASLLFGAVMLFPMAAEAQVMEVSSNGAICPTGCSRTGSPSGGGTYFYPSTSVAQSLSASCSPNALSSTLSQNVVWFSNVTGGGGSYAYFWGGSDGLSGNTSSVTRAYTAPGIKTATLSVVSGGQSVTVNCSSAVNVGGTSATAQPIATGFGASCYAAEERIAPGESGTWLAVVTGLNPASATTYSWEGTDNLIGTGPAAFKNYTTQGRKFAVLTVTNGTTRSVTACTNNINVAPRVVAAARPAPQKQSPAATSTPPASPALQGICSASVAKAEVGSEVVWRATSIGGTATSTFSWAGDEELKGAAQTVTKKYETEGAKHASVTIVSGEKRVTVPCTPVEVVPFDGNGLLAAGFFSLKNPLWLVIGALLAAMIGVYFAMRKRRREEAEAEDEDLKPKH